MRAKPATIEAHLDARIDEAVAARDDDEGQGEEFRAAGGWVIQTNGNFRLRAREDLERAPELRTHGRVPAASLAETEFMLARALATLDVRAPDPRELASSALEHLDGADGDLVSNAELIAWLAAHP